MVEKHVILNGEIFTADKPILEYNNRAFCYGDGLFESMHAYSTQVQFLDKHLNRLYAGLKAIKAEPSSRLNQDILTKDIQRLLNRDKLFSGVRIRLTVFRNQGGLYTPTQKETSYLIEANPLENAKYELNSKGYSIDIFTDLKKQINLFSPYKTCNSLLYVMAGQYGTEHGLNESLIINDQNHIIESIASNIFLQKGDIIYTPSVESGCVDGIMRSVVIDLIKKAGLTVETSIPFTEEHLLAADEIFLTNAVKGIQWVSGFRDRRYFNKLSRSLVEKLNIQAFG